MGFQPFFKEFYLIESLPREKAALTAFDAVTVWRRKAKDRSLKAKELKAKMAKRICQQEAARDARRRGGERKKRSERKERKK